MTSQEKSRFKEFESKCTEEKDPERKVQLCIDFMREVLSQGGAPRLKDFWDAKNLCIQAFKERMNPIKRKAFWDEYVELTTEAKRLKTILDEQSSFNLEQIELALQALGADIDSLSAAVEKIPPLELPNNVRRLMKDPKGLCEMHAELFVLNTLSARLNALRKEVINTDMRIKHKNVLLKSISESSDKVFPKRRDLIKTLSDQFLLVVEAFALGRMKDDVPPFHVKDEIRKLQQLSKQLSLSSPVFKKTRDILSECWDTVKKREKAFAEENALQAEEFTENFEKLKPKCEAFAGNPTTIEEGNTLMNELKSEKLSKHGYRALSDFVQTGIKILKQKRKEEREKKIAAEQERMQRLVDRLQSANELSVEEAKALESEIVQDLESMTISEVEKMKLDALLYEMKGETYLKMGANAELSQFKKFLREKLNEYRKGAGSSSLDFEKAMLFSELTDSCRRLLDRIESHT